MSCKVTQGIGNSCEDLLKSGGISKTFWVGYKADLDTQISQAQTADINTLDFGAYGGLYRFDMTKFSGSFSDSMQRANGSGNVSYLHQFVCKLLTGSTTDDVTLQKLHLGDDIFIVTEDTNQEFFILGSGNGLQALSSENSSGETGDSDIRDTVTLQSSEKIKKLRFRLAGGYQATLDYIESREI